MIPARLALSMALLPLLFAMSPEKREEVQRADPPDPPEPPESDTESRVSCLIRDGAGKRPLPDVLRDIAALDTRTHEPGCPLTVPLAIASCPCPGERRKREAEAKSKRLASALAGLIPLPPAPKPGSGRERHLRRLQARRIAGELGLREDDVYRALGEGKTEEQIRWADARRRIVESLPLDERPGDNEEIRLLVTGQEGPSENGVWLLAADGSRRRSG